MESSEELAFIQALQENPMDETARLVYADWLDDHGQEARASYMRSLVEISRQMDSLKKTENSVGSDWLDSINLVRATQYEAALLKKGLRFLSFKEVRDCKAGHVTAIDFALLLGDTIRERYESMHLRFSEMYNVLVRNTKERTNVAWICTTPEIASIFEVATIGFQPTKLYSESFITQDENDPFVHKGTIMGRWELFTHTRLQAGKVVMGLGRDINKMERIGRIEVTNYL